MLFPPGLQPPPNTSGSDLPIERKKPQATASVRLFRGRAMAQCFMIKAPAGHVHGQLPSAKSFLTVNLLRVPCQGSISPADARMVWGLVQLQAARRRYPSACPQEKSVDTATSARRVKSRSWCCLQILWQSGTWRRQESERSRRSCSKDL